ncbi:MAG: hypothetical protein HRU16_10415, partial [Planctomycetes bacterium]|nr:hypothetical protein [Planctomycetota bacterium]
MIRRTIFALVPVAFVLTILAPNESFAQLGRPGLVATEQIVVGGILGSDPTITAGLNDLLAARLLTSPFLLEVADLDDPTYTNDDNITLNVFGGIDLDGDNTNNGSGENEFVIDP